MQLCRGQGLCQFGTKRGEGVGGPPLLTEEQTPSRVPPHLQTGVGERVIAPWLKGHLRTVFKTSSEKKISPDKSLNGLSLAKKKKQWTRHVQNSVETREGSGNAV